MLHIIAQGTNNVIQECCNLGELAIWLGVGKVGVSLSNSHALRQQWQLVMLYLGSNR
jgi:hypothetical protein